jgi:hypothetical protein
LKISIAAEATASREELMDKIGSGKEDSEVGTIFRGEEDEDDCIEEALRGVEDGLEIIEIGICDGFRGGVVGEIKEDPEGAPQTNEKEDDWDKCL